MLSTILYAESAFVFTLRLQFARKTKSRSTPQEVGKSSDHTPAGPQGGVKHGVGTARPQDLMAKTENLRASHPHPGFRTFLNPPEAGQAILQAAFGLAKRWFWGHI